jgi:hypothetical protein
MTGVVHHGIIEHDEVLIRPASPYINTCTTLACIADAGQQLNYFQQIHLTQKCRHLFYLFNGQAYFSHLCRLFIVIALAGAYHYFLLEFGAGDHGNIQHRIF